LRFQPKETGDVSLKGLPGADVPSESKPEPGVSSEMRELLRPLNICGSRRSLCRPSSKSSSFPGSVANLLSPTKQGVKIHLYAGEKKRKEKTYMLCSVGNTKKPSRNASYSATSSSAWRVSSASTARAKTGSFATAARNTPRRRCLRASSSPAREGKSQYGVRAQRHSGLTEADCQSTTAS
jgi:hypothetical protein